MFVSEIQLQKKWKSIRDCFQKYISNPTRTKRPYIYCRQLQFLLKDQDVPQKDEGTAATSESDEDKPIKKKRVWRYKKKLKLVKDEETSEEDNDTTFDVALDDSRDYTDTAETGRPAKVPKLNKPAEGEFVFANVDAQIKPESDDPDRMFLLSLLPHFKSVPEELRLNVKMELMQVLRNANYNTVREHKLI